MAGTIPKLNIKSIYELDEQTTKITPPASTQNYLSSLDFESPGTSWNDTFVEVSMPTKDDNTRVSRKLDIGKVLDYLIAQLKKLEELQTTENWATKKWVKENFYPITGGDILGAVTIKNPGGISPCLKCEVGQIDCPSLYASGNITATGTATVGALVSNGNSIISGTLGVSGATTLSSTIINGNLTNTGSSYTASFNDVIAATISDTGALTVGGTADITGNTTITGTLTAESSFQAQSGKFDTTLEVGTDASISGKLAVSSTADNACAISGKVTAVKIETTSDAKFGGTLEATGAAILKSTADITGNTTIGGTLSITDSTDDACKITGKVTVGSLASSGNATIGGTLEATGAAILKSTADITGDTTIGGTLEVAGDTVIGGTLEVAGDTVLKAKADVAGKATMNQEIEAKGAATFGSTVSIAGKATLSDELTVAKSTTCTGSLTMNDDGMLAKGKSLTVNGKIVLAVSDSDKNGTIIADGTAEPKGTIQNNSGSLHINKVSIGSATVGSSDAEEITTVLKVNGNFDCKNTGTKATLYDAVFLNTVKAPKFMSPEFTLAEKGDDGTYTGKSCGISIDSAGGLYSNIGIAELTAQAACWS